MQQIFKTKKNFPESKQFSGKFLNSDKKHS